MSYKDYEIPCYIKKEMAVEKISGSKQKEEAVETNPAISVAFVIKNCTITFLAINENRCNMLIGNNKAQMETTKAIDLIKILMQVSTYKECTYNIIVGGEVSASINLDTVSCSTKPGWILSLISIVESKL